MNPHKFEEAKAVLMAFIGEMHSWQSHAKLLEEKAQAGRLSYDACDEKLWATLKPIFDRYVKHKKMPENFVISESYDPKGEKIIEITEVRGRLVIVTEQTTTVPAFRMRYTLERYNGAYKILENRKRFDEYENKYVPWDLLL